MITLDWTGLIRASPARLRAAEDPDFRLPAADAINIWPRTHNDAAR